LIDSESLNSNITEKNRPNVTDQILRKTKTEIQYQSTSSFLKPFLNPIPKKKKIKILEKPGPKKTISIIIGKTSNP
jgi:hypothetical protein